MTKDEARKAAEVMLAYADGKEIEIIDLVDNTWNKIDNPGFDWRDSNYRIKPQPTYRPFKTAEECWQEMLKHQPFGWICRKEEKMLVVDVCYEGIINGQDGGWLFSEAFDRFTFADGTPFGIKVEE